VAVTGTTARRDGSTASVPVTAHFALADLLVYEGQLESVFPPSGDAYPADSLARLRRARASEWVARLRQLAAQHDSGVTGWQLVPFAEVAARAGDDTLAQRLFDARLAEVATAPGARAYVLTEAVMTFSDQRQDSIRLSRNLAIAEHYVAQLRGVALAGFPANYRATNDSTQALYRRWKGEDTLMATYDAIGLGSRVMPHATDVFTLAPRFDPDERSPVIMRTYFAAVSPIMSSADDARRTRAIDSLGARTIAAAGTVPPGWLSNEPASVRSARMASLAASTRESIRQIAESFALLGTPAPSLIAHRWLNTSDTVLHAAPRTVSLADGRVHLILLSDFNDGPRLAILNRVQHLFPDRADGVFVTFTRGYTGTVLATPQNEIAWLSRYLVDLRHFTMPVAIWAGARHPISVLTGDGVGYVPDRSPLDTSVYQYRVGSFVLVDARGQIRATFDINTRAQEAALRHRIEQWVANTQVDSAANVSAPANADPSTASPRH